MYDYPDVPFEKLHPGAQQFVQDFHALPEEEKERRPMLYHLLQSGTPPWKMSKKDSEYTDRSKVKGQTCANCWFAYQKVVTKKYICSKISGKIKPEGWCKLWSSGPGKKKEKYSDYAVTHAGRPGMSI